MQAISIVLFDISLSTTAANAPFYIFDANQENPNGRCIETGKFRSHANFVVLEVVLHFFAANTIGENLYLMKGDFLDAIQYFRSSSD